LKTYQRSALSFVLRESDGSSSLGSKLMADG
jgi:hypothetical protein